MTSRQPTHSTPEPKKPRATKANADFERPDAQRAAEGAKPHRETSSTKANDAQHGYTQDSGYATSGGYRGDAASDGMNVSEDGEVRYDEDLPETD